MITPDDLGVYLKDPSIDTVRATEMIADAQTLCESILNPLPTTASVVVKRVAGRGYVTTTSARQSQVAGAGSPFGAQPGGMGGIHLYAEDIADLRRLAGGGGAFSIDMLPAGYTPPVSYTLDDWDQIK